MTRISLIIPLLIAASPLVRGQDTATLPGQVVAPDGRPVAGATVTLSSPWDGPAPPPATRTTPDGRFALAVPASAAEQTATGGLPVVLVATAPGFGIGWASRDDPRADGLIRLEPAGPPIRGRIRDHAGNPIAGARIIARTIFEPRRTTPDETTEAALDRFLAAPEGRVDWRDLRRVEVRLMTLASGDGRFTLRGVGAGRIVRLEVSGDTIATTGADAIGRPGPIPELIQPGGRAWERYDLRPDSFDLAVLRSRPVVGIVRDAATRQPLADWAVSSSFIDSASSRIVAVTAQTDATGRYRLDGQPWPERYRIFFVPPRGEPYLPAVVGKVAELGAEPVVCDLDARRGVMTSGRVTDRATGQPVAGIVQVFHIDGLVDPDPAESELAATNARRIGVDGQFEIVAPLGRNVVRFRADRPGRYQTDLRGLPLLAAPGRGRGRDRDRDGPDWFGLHLDPAQSNAFAPLDLDLDPDPDQHIGSATVDLQVEAKPTVELMILDPDGHPLAGAEVEGIDAEAPARTRPEESARVTLFGLDPATPRRVTARHKGRRLAGTMLVNAAGPPPTLRLLPWGEIRGRLVGVDGQPRGNARFASGSQFFEGPRVEPIAALPTDPDQAPCRTDRDGQFHLVGLVPGLHYSASIREHGNALDGDFFIDVGVRPGDVRELGDVRTVQPAP